MTFWAELLQVFCGAHEPEPARFPGKAAASPWPSAARAGSASPLGAGVSPSSQPAALPSGS